MADLVGVLTELADRVRWAIAEAAKEGLVLEVTEGQRSLKEQWRLWDKMQDAKKKYGAKWQQHANLAAYPGSSDHGKNPAIAVDLACANPTSANIKRHGEIVRSAGLQKNIPSEYWHLKLAPIRKPLPIAATKEEAMTMVIEPTGLVIERPDGSGWTIGRRGHVYAWGVVPFSLGWSEATRNENHHVVGFVGTKSGNGYWIVDNKGQVYGYGDAGWPGNYQKAWGPGEIIAAWGNDRQPNGGVTLLRDDTKNLNQYALPA